MIKILLQTTIPYTEDDWHVGRFSLLRRHLESLCDDADRPLYEMTARDREENFDGNDVILSKLDETDFDELWLIGVDTGKGLSIADCEGITRFHQSGGGILSSRDHNDLGSSLCSLGGIGKAHFFHSKNPDPDESRRVRDNRDALNIDFPNYHSGANGDYQRIDAVGDVHELLLRSDGSTIEYFPSHPHEGGVGVTEGADSLRVIAMGKSTVSGRDFNLAVVLERATDTDGGRIERAIAESSFHHLADYNWDIDSGCPSFVEELPGDGYKRDPAKLDDIKRYCENVARWLAN